jgi:hypothetical protein
MTLDRLLRRDKPNKETFTSANVCLIRLMAKPIARSGHVPDQEKPIHDDKELPHGTARQPSTIVDGKEVSTSTRINCFKRTTGSPDGGASRDRTDDLKLAKLALSQLSYGPVFTVRVLVGPGGFEPPTPRLSSVCSNQLSYRPLWEGLFIRGRDA